MSWAFAKAALAAAVVGFVALNPLAPARAAVMVLSYDPAYGAAFPSLGWKVSADLYVPQGCNWPIFSTYFAPPECQGTAVRNTWLQFYDLADPLQTVVENIYIGDYGRDLPPPTLFPSSETQELINLVIQQPLFGEPTNYLFQTSMSLRQQASHTIAGGGDAWFSLGLSSSGAELIHFTSLTQTRTQALDAGQRSTGQVVYTAKMFDGPDADYVPPLFTAGLVAQTVPEPGSAALVLAALAAAGWARRRRA